MGVLCQGGEGLICEADVFCETYRVKPPGHVTRGEGRGGIMAFLAVPVQICFSEVISNNKD